MNYRLFDHTGIEVSEIGLGTWQLGGADWGEVDEGRALDTYNREGQAFNVGETFAGLPFEKGVELSEVLSEMLPEGMTMAQMALRWILDFDAVSVIIPGASNPKQARANATASDLPQLGQDLHTKLRDFYQTQVAAYIRGQY